MEEKQKPMYEAPVIEELESKLLYAGVTGTSVDPVIPGGPGDHDDLG